MGENSYMGPTWIQFGHNTLILPIWDPFVHACWDTYRAVKPQNMSRCLKFRIYEEEGFYYSCSRYPEGDLHLCFLVCKQPVFSRRGSYGPLESYLWGSGCDLTQTGLYSKLAGSLLFRIYMYEEEKCENI